MSSRASIPTPPTPLRLVRRRKGLPRFDPNDTDALRAALNAMTEPARRHKCEICALIFECHLCSIHADHDLHNVKTKLGGPFICEECLVKHDIGVMVTGHHDKTAIRGAFRFGVPTTTDRLVFYDALTGHTLGRGMIRIAPDAATRKRQVTA